MGQYYKSHFIIAWAVLIVAVIPAVIEVQFVSVGFAIAGLIGFSVIAVLSDRSVVRVLSAVARLPGCGLLQTWRDLRDARVQVPASAP